MIKQTLLNIIDFLRYQIENDQCTLAEMKSIHNLIVNNLDIDASTKEIADFYGESESNVRNVVSRHYSKDKKAKRKVYYNFAWVSSVIPKNWCKRWRDI